MLFDKMKWDIVYPIYALPAFFGIRGLRNIISNKTRIAFLLYYVEKKDGFFFVFLLAFMGNRISNNGQF